MERRLFRNRDERVVFGVCGGLAYYLNLDPTLVRVLFILTAVFTSGAVVLGYIVLAIIMPEPEKTGPITGEVIRENLDDLERRTRELGDDLRHAFQRRPPGEAQETHPGYARRGDPWVVGLVLVVAGIIFLMENLWRVSWLRFGQLWPLLIIVVGIALLLRRRER